MPTINLSKAQAEMVIYELNNSLRGDDDPYDNKLKRIIKKVEEACSTNEK